MAPGAIVNAARDMDRSSHREDLAVDRVLRAEALVHREAGDIASEQKIGASSKSEISRAGRKQCGLEARIGKRSDQRIVQERGEIRN